MVYEEYMEIQVLDDIVLYKENLPCSGRTIILWQDWGDLILSDDSDEALLLPEVVVTRAVCIDMDFIDMQVTEAYTVFCDGMGSKICYRLEVPTPAVRNRPLFFVSISTLELNHVKSSSELLTISYNICFFLILLEKHLMANVEDEMDSPDEEYEFRTI
ncbi:hypothetical protein OPV22_000622 [Ensete ventricosum]|uniref:DUF1618 domain-containing protein n=1 Tax=Ensete ventricosum TaxID=4639 RepID=A0AAV8RTH4_ENSVE|nr:hypothetical protein OPV22_000622 [Ensete ventricosum]